jgi:hypothetical protein
MEGLDIQTIIRDTVAEAIRQLSRTTNVTLNLNGQSAADVLEGRVHWMPLSYEEAAKNDFALLTEQLRIANGKCDSYEDVARVNTRTMNTQKLAIESYKNSLNTVQTMLTAERSLTQELKARLADLARIATQGRAA